MKRSIHTSSLSKAALSLALLSLSGCGSFQSASPSSTLGSALGPNGQKVCVDAAAGTTVIRRLSREELKNSFRDILGISSDPTASLPYDTPSTDNFTNNGGLLSLGSAFTAAYVDVVENAVRTASTENKALFSTCSSMSDEACIKTRLSDFMRKAFRRPVAAAQLQTFVDDAKKLTSNGYSLSEVLSAGYQRILLSPRFLFQSAFGSAGQSGSAKKLSQHELAERLSFFLWVGPPDEELLRAADANQLSNPATLRAQIARMVKDSKSSRFARQFINEWTEIGRLSRGDISDALRADLLKESELLLTQIMQKDLSPLELLNADFTFMNENLATNVYGNSTVKGSQFQLVSQTSAKRKGLLTQGAFLMLTSSSDTSKPTGRGHRILSNILCSPPPPFPDGITITPLEPTDRILTMREKMELHRSSGACIGCHQRMDPIGLALENFGPFGRYRTQYANGLAIDSSGVLDGSPIRDHIELINELTDGAEFKNCISRKLMTFAIGRAFENAGSDRCMTQSIGEKTVNKNNKFSDLIFEIAQSLPFQANQTDSQGDLQ